MHTKFSHRLLAIVLAVCTLLGLVPIASAASISEGSRTATISHAESISILPTNKGNVLKAAGYTYTTNDGLSGPAYCIDYGLINTTKPLPITGKYNSHPAAAGVFANGYPQHSLSLFLDLFLDDNPVLAGLTEEEYRYATQIAVWASLGQLGVEGTAFTAGRCTVPQPNGDLQQMRTFRAVQLLLAAAALWDRIYYTGMYIRLDNTKLGGNITVPANMTLEAAAMQGLYGLKLETINGRNYYTREYIFASATSAYYNDYTLDAWAANAPAGTIFVDKSNRELARSTWDSTATWRVPVEEAKTTLNANGFEYSGVGKICIPADNVPPSGEITINCAAQIMQYQIYLAYNETANEQSYIIADPSKGSTTANAALAWGSEITERGSLCLTKVGSGAQALKDAEFRLSGSNGDVRTAITDSKGIILWTDLDPKATYTLTETNPPAGYTAIEPRTVTITASHVEYITIQDDSQRTIAVHKVDKQTGYSLRGAVIAFEQIDGTYRTTKTTDHAGMIQMNGEELPFGSYKVYEVATPEGYEVDGTAQTVHWDGKNDVTLTFENVRKPTLIISKRDSYTGYSLDGATFDVFRNGIKVATTTTGADGCAYVSGIASGYYEVRETACPSGYLLDTEFHGITVDLYDPATTDDPIIVVENDPLPSLVIKKYDRTTLQPMANVTFEVYRDTTLVGRYTTNANGEIYLEKVEQGTYTVQEVAVPSSHVVNSTPQSVELLAGKVGPSVLVFFNDLKPYISLVKVDSETLRALPNATYRISRVGGTFSKEFTTDRNGEINLSELETGAYQVVETKAPDGYLIDDGVRAIQLNAGERAQFVFTNTRKPSLVVAKYDPNTGTYLSGASFRIAKIEDGSHYLDRITDTHGRIAITDLEPGVYSVVELAAPEGYIRRSSEFHVELFPGQTSELVVANDAKPSLKIIKTDAVTGEPISGVTFTVRKADRETLTTVTTGTDGTVTLNKMDVGAYVVTEQSVPNGYLLDETPQMVTLVPNKTGLVQFQNYPKPDLEIIKTDINGLPIEGAVFTVASKDGVLVGDYYTDVNGRICVYGLNDIYYIVTEKSVPAPYILDPTPHEVLMVEGKQTSITLSNKRKPDLTVVKLDAITKDPLESAKFTVWHSTTASMNGELHEVGRYVTDEAGTFTIKAVEPGWYRITETEAPAGYSIDSATRDVFLEADVDKTVTFEDTPLSAIVIKKVDATTGDVLQGAQFRVRYFSGVSGTGGTVIGEYTTSTNGTVVITGLAAGTYIVEEIKAPTGYTINDAPKTVYISGKEQSVVSVVFADQPDSGLMIHKIDSVTGKPLAGAVFEVRTDSGAVVGNSNGRYTTNVNGLIYLPNLDTDTYVITEVKAPAGYELDSTPQAVKLKHGETHKLTFSNTPTPVGGLIITKYDADTRKPLAGATFKVTTSSGEYVANYGGTVSSNGLYTTDINGVIRIVGLKPDTYVVTETRAPSGYELDAVPQTVRVNNNDTQTLAFYDTPTPMGDLRIIKLDAETRQPISGVQFEVTRIDGRRVGLYTTNSRGIIDLSGITPGWYTVVETRAADGYELDATPRDVEVKNKQTSTLVITNRLHSGIIIRKVDSATGTGLSGAVFVLYDSRENPIGEYRSDQRGYVYIDGLDDGKYQLREIIAPRGYILDNDRKTIYVKYGGSSEIRWENTAIMGQIQVVKRSADYNTTNGLPAGTLLSGAVFEVYDERTGNLADTITTGVNGLAVTKALPLGRYVLREVTAPSGYLVNDKPITAVLEYSGQIVRFDVANMSVQTGVTITKTGPKEIVGGQPVRYVISGIANTSNVPLDSFYWRDALPSPLTLDKVITGTYSGAGSYKVVYKVNDREYRTLADNLSPSVNHTLAATPAALGLAADERITEIMFVFGTVQNGFKQVESPTIYCTAASGLVGGMSITNVADAGGVYMDKWIQAVSRCVTTVYAKPINLPRTGY